MSGPMTEPREALATSICSTFDMGHHHHEAFLQPDHCDDGLSDADELLRSLRAQGYSVARSEGPGLDALSQTVYRLNTFARHRPWCREFRGPGDCTCGLYALLDSILCICGHKVNVHTTRDAADVVGWPCSKCQSARCPRFALAAQENPT